MEGTAEVVNNDLDLLVVSQILTHPPPPKRSKLMKKRPVFCQILVNFVRKPTSYTNGTMMKNGNVEFAGRWFKNYVCVM
jgi:hypothetical protein